MAFIKVPEELLDLDITPGQFKVLVNLIRYSFDDGHSYIGYTKLAAACHTSKGAIVKSVKELAALGLIDITHRGTFSRSNDIRLTFDNGLVSSGRISGENSGQTLKQGSLNESPKGSLNESLKGSLNESRGTQEKTSHKDIRFKYQDLNLNTREEGTQNDTPRVYSNNTAPADVAAGRSAPGEQARSESAKEVMASSAQLDIDDLCLWEGFVEAYPRRYPWFELVRVKNQLLLRGIGKMGDSMLTAAWDDVAGWFSLRGRNVAKAGQNQRFSGEIVIRR